MGFHRAGLFQAQMKGPRNKTRKNGGSRFKYGEQRGCANIRANGLRVQEPGKGRAKCDKQ